MKRNKMAAALLGMTLSLTALSAADEQYVEAKMSKKPNGCTGPTLCATNAMLRNNACDANWKFQIGLIYEQARFAEMHPGTSFVPSNIYDTADDWSNVTMRPIEATFDYDVGLLVSLGYFMDHDNWYAQVHFDWLNSKKKTTYNQAGTTYELNENVNSLLFTGITGPYSFDNIAYEASMNFYTLDVTLSRGAWISKCFSLEYGMGIEALWFDTKQAETGTPVSGAPLNVANVVSYESKQENWGVGPRVIFNGLYHIVQELYFFMDNSIGVLYGEATNNEYSSIGAGGSIDATRRVDGKTYYSMQYFVPVRSIIGAKIAKYCLEEKHYIALKVGYDARAVLSATNPNKGFVANGLYLNFEWTF